MQFIKEPPVRNIDKNEPFIFDGNKKRRAKETICKYCKNKFLIRADKTQKYCSKECRSNDHTTLVKCETCGKEFKKRNSHLKNSKNKKYFCCRNCKDTAQRIGGCCPEIMPPHYGSSQGREKYLNIIRTTPNCKCVGCGENRKFLLEIHHIDGNHNNNEEDNFEIVCANCHKIRHLKETEEGWMYSTKELTPVHLLESFT